jgi:hypothetical protein
LPASPIPADSEMDLLPGSPPPYSNLSPEPPDYTPNRWVMLVHSEPLLFYTCSWHVTLEDAKTQLTATAIDLLATISDNQYIVWGTNGANFSVYEECRPWAAGIAKQVTLMKKYWISAFEEEGEDTVSDGSEASEMEV